MLIIARVVRLAGPVTIAVLVAGIGIHVFDVSTQPAPFARIDTLARALASPFADVFLPADEKLRLTLNWGLAAIFYGCIAPLVAYLLARADDGIGSWRRTRRA
jgi:hypothetical protein